MNIHLLIAAILAMRNPQLMVFGGSFGALSAMSILSALLGQLLPAILPKTYTQTLAALLFIVFGFKMFNDAQGMEGGRKEVEEEMQEAMEEIEHINNNDTLPTTNKSKTKSSLRDTLSIFLSPQLIQAFALTFLGEWGDRSQISTIALAAAHVSNLYHLFLTYIFYFWLGMENCCFWYIFRTWYVYSISCFRR